MAIPVARVHLAVAHAALPALLPTPPKCKMLPLLPTPPCVAAALPKPAAKPSRADADERWDARKTKPAESAGRPSGRGMYEPPRKNPTSPPQPGRADSVDRWDAHKTKTAAASSASSSSSSAKSSLASSSKCPTSRAMCAERGDVRKKRRPSQAEPLDDDGESSSTGSNDVDMEEEEEIVYKPLPPRAMYAGPGFVAASPEPSMLPTPTAFFVRVA